MADNDLTVTTVSHVVAQFVSSAGGSVRYDLVVRATGAAVDLEHTGRNPRIWYSVPPGHEYACTVHLDGNESILVSPQAGGAATYRVARVP